jgi:hypothetical protein
MRLMVTLRLAMGLPSLDRRGTTGRGLLKRDENGQKSLA